MKIGIVLAPNNVFSAPYACQEKLFNALVELDSGFEFVPVKEHVPRDLDILHIDRIPSRRWELWKAYRAPKVVAHAHGNIVYSHPHLSEMTPYERFRYSLGERIGRTMCDHFAPVSDYLRDFLVGWGVDPAKITTVHNGVDPIYFKTPNDGDHFGSQFILHVSKWQPKKNTEAIIEAMPRIRERYPDVSLIIAGPGHSGRPYPSTPGVFVVGEVTTSQLVRLYHSAEVFVFPSIHETFGLPLVEAMAAGTPVVTSRTTCLPEIVGNAGEYCVPTSYGIAASVKLLLGNDRKWKQLSRDGRERAMLFTWERSAKAAISMYEKVGA